MELKPEGRNTGQHHKELKPKSHFVKHCMPLCSYININFHYTHSARLDTEKTKMWLL